MSLFFSDLNPNFPGLSFGCKHFVDDSFIDKVNKYIKTQQLEKATFSHYDGAKDLDTIRNSRIHWMADERYKDDLIPLYQELSARIRNVNDQHWKWIIDGYESFQYTEYDESYKGHYDWHIDYGYKQPDQSLSRKLSFTLGISNANDYEGGELLTKRGPDTESVKLDKGEIYIFPSWMLHKVTPVTKGKRKVVVGWARGPVV